MFLKIYEKFLEAIFKSIIIFISAAYVFMTGITIIEVVRRYLFGCVFSWSEELVRFLFIWTVFLGAAAVFRKGEMIFLDLITSKLSKRTYLILQLFTNTVVLIFLIYLFQKGYSYSVSPVMKRQFSSGLKLNMSYVYMCIPLGFGIMIIYAIDNFRIILKKIRDIRNGGD